MGGVTLNVIDARMDLLYTQEYANYNLFYPVCWVIPSLNNDGSAKSSKDSAQKIYDIMGDFLKTDGTDFTVKGSTFPADQLQNIATIKGIPSVGSGFTQEKAGLKENQDKNYATISVKFYETETLKTWRFLQNWRKAWKTIEFSMTGKAGALTPRKKIQTIQGDKTHALPEGYLVIQHVRINNDGTMETLGWLKITGMIPNDIPFPEVGPGKSRGSDVPNLEVKFTASNIAYFDANKVMYQFY